MQRSEVSANENVLLKITGKEMGQFFRAPIAWLFLVAFLLISLFVFFWVETFFARNIADVRPLFEWMPLLLIFLSAALTMKMWSEERRSGTLEHVLTQPVPLWQFVVGKFLACWALLAIALIMTLPLPITVSLLGDIDWGPVFSGYLAALLLGGAYLSMGLFVSARCDNQIVSLILTVALAGAFYLIGSGLLVNLVNNQTAEVLRGIGTGSRFESITRGVVDFRDLYYYFSLIAAFIALNIFSLERGRWAEDGNRQHHSFWRWGVSLVLINVLFANVWLTQVPTLRWDTTRGNMYSISDSTEQYLAQLQEPMLIRGYFSQKTHPLLSPLVPQIQDLLREYEIVGGGRVNVEIVDPTTDPELEDEANNLYNIQPTPFRINDRHQAALVNSYFNILIKYGDEQHVLGFNDLIEVKMGGDTDVDVQLRNPEYDITSAIKKALYAYQSGGDLFSTLEEPIKLTAYVSADEKLPGELVKLREVMEEELQSVKDSAGENFTYEFVQPEANGGEVAKQIAEDYGFTPMAMGLREPTQFYFYVTVGQGDQLLQMPLDDSTRASFKRSLDSVVKRFSEGYTKTVALVKPEPMPQELANHVRANPKPRFEGLKQMLSENMNVIDEDLADGRVDTSADVLVIMAPELESDVELFAIDQFLMRGGTVIVASSPFSASMTRTRIDLDNYPNSVLTWLEHHGLSMPMKVVMDSQNAAFPVPTLREVGGMRFQEMQLVDYPYFIDVRGDGLNQESLMTSGLPQVTVPWASPLIVDDTKVANLQVTQLLQSSPEAWLSEDRRIMPTSQQIREGYPQGDNPKRHLLAAALEGQFTSYFAGKDSPLVDYEPSEEEEQAGDQPINAVVNRSAESARLIVFSSNDMFRDQIVSMLGTATGGMYLNSIQLISNAVDWAVEDSGLLGIRARGHFNRTLVPMEDSQHEFWEYLNYGLALFGLFVLWLITRYLHKVRHARYQRWLAA